MLGTLTLGKKAKKAKEAVGKLSDKLEKLYDKQKGTVKKLDEKDKEIAQKNIDANKPKTKSKQKVKRPIYLKPIGPLPKPSAKQVQVTKAKQNRLKKQTKPKVEITTKLAPKEQIEKFKKQQESLKKSKVTKPKAKQTQVTKAKQNRAKKQSKSKAKTGFVLQGNVVDKTPKLPTLKRESKALTVTNTSNNKSKSFGNSGQKTKTNVKKLLSMKGAKVFSKGPSKKKTGNIISRNKKKLGALAVAGSIPFAIDTDDSKVKSKNKDIKKIQSLKKETAPKINKPKTSKVDVKKLSKEKKRTNITAGGNTGFGPKGNIFAKNEKDRKRLMDLYGGTGSAAYKAAVKGTQGNLSKKKLSEGTKDKTIGSKPISVKTALNKKFKEKAKAMNTLLQSTVKKPKRNKTIVEKVFGGGPKEEYNIKKGRASKAAMKGAKASMKKEYPQLMKRVTKKSTGGNLKSLPPKSENPGIHKLPAKVKMNMGFKPMFGGGLVSSFYDKPEKAEKHKGNMNVARQVKGYGKAKKKT